MKTRRYVQTTLSNEEFEQVKIIALANQKPLHFILRAAIVQFLANNTTKENETNGQRNTA